MISLECALHQQLFRRLSECHFTSLSDHWDNTPMGVEWNAEILATQAGGRKIAIQTIWFDDADEDTQEQMILDAIEKNKLIVSSGVETLWLLEKNQDNADLIDDLLYEYKNVTMPMFAFTHNNDLEHPQFFISGWRDNADQQSQYYFGETEAYSFNESSVIRYLKIDMFLLYYLIGAIRWTLLEEEAYISLALAERNCWKCHKPQNVIKTVNVVIKPFHDADNEVLRDIQTVVMYSPLCAAQINDLTVQLLNQTNMRGKYNYGVIKRRYSKTIDSEYLSTGCPHCGALQGQNFIDHIILNPQDYNHTPLLNVGPLQVPDREEYETMGEWIFVENEHLQIHQHRVLG